MDTIEERSKLEFRAKKEDVSSFAEIKTGCLQRIAKATEVMAMRHTGLIEERDFYAKAFEDQKRRADSNERRISALKGAITKMRKKRNPADATNADGNQTQIPERIDPC